MSGGYTSGQKLFASQMEGLTASPTTATGNGTATTSNSTTEVRDAVLGNFTFTSLTGHRYEIRLMNLIFNASGDPGDTWALRIRDGGSSTPTTASTLVAETVSKTIATGSGGRRPIHIIEQWLPSAGSHTLSFFAKLLTDVSNVDGSQFTPCAPAVETGSTWYRSLYVVDLGLA